LADRAGRSGSALPGPGSGADGVWRSLNDIDSRVEVSLKARGKFVSPHVDSRVDRVPTRRNPRAPPGLNKSSTPAGGEEYRIAAVDVISLRCGLRSQGDRMSDRPNASPSSTNGNAARLRGVMRHESLHLGRPLVVLAGLFVLEGALPYDQGRDRRHVHGARNPGLAVASGSVGVALAPLLLAASRLGSEQSWGLCPRLDLGGVGCALISFLLFDLWTASFCTAMSCTPASRTLRSTRRWSCVWGTATRSRASTQSACRPAGIWRS